MRYGRFCTSAAISALWLGAGLVPSKAQTDTQTAATQAAAATGFETVIVTARKRAEDAQTVPISITALSQGDLDQLHIADHSGLNVSRAVGRCRAQHLPAGHAQYHHPRPAQFRQFFGQGGNPGLSFDTASAVYVDGVYYARAIGLTGALFDMNSVDVLKGPQGTLVGRNTTGGAILLQTNEPTPDFGGYVKVLGGDYGQYGLQGAVNIPLTDDLLFRAAILGAGQQGLYQELLSPIRPAAFPTASRPKARRNWRGASRSNGRRTTAFSLLLRADISEEHDTGSTYHDLGYFVGTTLATGNKPSICNIPGACVGFTDLLGHQVAPYFTTVTATSASGVNTVARRL